MVFLSASEYVHIFYCLFISVLSLEIQLTEGGLGSNYHVPSKDLSFKLHHITSQNRSRVDSTSAGSLTCGAFLEAIGPIDLKPTMSPVFIFQKLQKEWGSEWLLFNANSAIFQLYHGENKFIFNEMMMRSALY